MALKLFPIIPALQLIGVSVTGLEPEFQPVVNHLLPHIISHKQDAHDMHLQVDLSLMPSILFCCVPYVLYYDISLPTDAN